MKKVGGINPDYADTDELDTDALDAVAEFTNGQVTFEELKNLIGPEDAEVAKNQFFGKENDPSQFFDDPETL
jgi:hypothetical protein